MNSKAIKRQLLAAIAMVLVAAIALGSSTYAWFVSSGTVTAEGMKVQAQTDAGLTIRYQKGTWGTTATAAMDTYMKLYPASTLNLAQWYHATAESANSYAEKFGTRSKVTDSIFVDGKYQDNGYVLMREFEIASTSTDTNAMVSGLVVSDVSVTGKSQTMSTALRVGVKTDSQFRIFAPVSFGPEDTNKPTDGYPVFTEVKNSENTGYTTAGTVNLATPNDKTAISDSHKTNAIVVPSDVSIPAKASNGLKVQIFIWFEGEDHNLNTDNFGADELSITVQFEGLSTGTGTGIQKVDLTNASVDTNDKVEHAGVTYYKVSIQTAGGQSLYTTHTTLGNDSTVYIIDDNGLLTDYTSNVTLPSTPGVAPSP